MSSAISGVSSSSYMPSLMSGGPRGAKRPDSDEMAAKIFSQLDTNNQGYLQASDLSSAISALGQQATSSGTSDSSASSSDDLFAALDSDSDGKVTKSELSTALKAVSDQLDSQFNAMRVANGMSGMQGAQGSAPPPPPPGGGRHGDHDGDKDDAGLSQDQLSSMASAASEAGETAEADRFSQLASNFEAADTNGDGKVSFAESIAYEKSQQESAAASGSTSSSDSTTTASTSTTTSTASATSTVQDDSKQAMLKKLMELARSYQPDTSTSTTSNALNLAV